MAAFLVLFLVGSASAADLQPRRELAPEPLVINGSCEQRLVVKFRDEIQAREAAGGGLTSRTGRELTAVTATAAALDLTFSRLIRLPEAKLNDLEARAAARSGRAQPDLAGMMIVHVPSADVASLVTAAEALQALAEVEWVCLESLGEPPPWDIPPTTPDLVANQGYREGNPGANCDFAWGWGARGAGVRLSDCEYGWNPDHEDLNEIDLHLEPGQTIDPDVFALDWDEHGTAVVGETSSMPNAYGCSGMVPDADLYTYPEWTVEERQRRVTCITHAIANSAAGDVVLLEMQTTGAGGDYGPAELNQAVWTVVKAGTDAGVIVVGAAGNGNQDLDSADYIPYMSRGDSGAIIVGAGINNVMHTKLSFSTYGSRVNVQAWGTGVYTLGYGDEPYGGGDEDQYYTATFGGTSSASPIVASACVAIQSFALYALGTPLGPAEMRQLLIDTGWPQGGTGGHIGPAVNIKKALKIRFPEVAVPGPDGLAGASLDLACRPNPFADRTSFRYELPRSGSVRLSVYDVSGRRVRDLVTAPAQGPGAHEVAWDGRDGAGRDLAAGTYFCRLTVDGHSTTVRAVFLR
jgi:hypothetical protein